MRNLDLDFGHSEETVRQNASTENYEASKTHLQCIDVAATLLVNNVPQRDYPNSDLAQGF